jgi:hypothetical protein
LGGDEKRDVSSADLYVVLTATSSCSVSFSISNHALVKIVPFPPSSLVLPWPPVT